MVLFSNEGEEAVRTEVTLPQRAGLQLVDLWNGKAERAAVWQTERGTAFSLLLPPCHVLLAVVEEAGAFDGECGKEEDVSAPGREPLDWTERFVLEERTDNRAVYRYRFLRETEEGTERFLVRGEEMAECFCNGKPAGVSFFGPHVFEIGSLLKDGENGVNEVKLMFTGSAANIFENAGLPFGLEKA